MCCGKAAKVDSVTEKPSFSAHQAAKPHSAYKRIQNAAPFPGVEGADLVTPRIREPNRVSPSLEWRKKEMAPLRLAHHRERYL